MNKQWIDPPNGWRYGFPQVWDSEKHPDIREWLLISGYPRDDVDFALHYCRSWPVEKELKVEDVEVTEPLEPAQFVKEELKVKDSEVTEQVEPSPLGALKDAFKDWEDSFISERDEFWNSLTQEQQLLTFCAVISKLTQAELVDGRSYRGVLYDTFEFGMESYVCAQVSGFLDLHNAIDRDC